MSHVFSRFLMRSLCALLVVMLLPAALMEAHAAPIDGIVSYWPLDEDTGLMAADSTGFQGGVLVNGPVWRPTEGRIGGALEFDGVNDYVDLGTMDIPVGSGLTIAFWCKVDDFGISDARFVSKGTSLQPEDQWWIVSTINNAALRFRLKAGGTTTTLFSGNNTIGVGVWTHVAVTYDGTAMRIYKDGYQVASVAKTGAIGTDPSVPVAMGRQPGANNPFDGLIDEMRIYNRALTQPEIAAMAGPLVPPVIDVWYGLDQVFGHHGIPQTWANILGQIPEVERVGSAVYSLNGGPDTPFPLGPDGIRLQRTGDFNIELDYDDLSSGANNLLISVIDTGGVRTDTTVTVHYVDGVRWDLPDVIDFEGAGKISDVAHVVDGRWELVTDGVRVEPEKHGYDRLIVVGEKDWPTEYETLIPITIHGSEFGGRGGIGVAYGWQGHDGPNLPRDGHPYQSISFIRDVTTNPIVALYEVINNGQNDVQVSSVHRNIQFNVTYLMRSRSESIGGGMSHFSTKVWQEGTPEPGPWDLEHDFITIPGSVLLICHRAEATFGNVIITPLPTFPQHLLTITVLGQGTVMVAPQNPIGYVDGEMVTVTAVPDPGWGFNGWSGGLTGTNNPVTMTMFSDSMVTAAFGSVATGIGDTPPASSFTLRQNHPNPFSDAARLEYELPESSPVDIEVYDVAGRRVYTRRTIGVSGENSFLFEGRDQQGRQLPNGVYFYRVRTASGSATRKMVRVR